MKGHLMKKYSALIAGMVLFSAGAGMYAVSGHFLSAMSLCKNSNVSSFLPGTVVKTTCPVVMDVGQNLTFRAAFYGPTGAASGETIRIPAHVEIKDPTGAVLYDTEFDDKTVVSFRPEKFGDYIATIRSLEDPDNRLHRGDTMIQYALGFLTSYDDVDNRVGNALNVMIALGNVTLLVGIGLVIFGIIKAARTRKQ